MPETKKERMDKYMSMRKSWSKRFHALNKDTPYQPKDSYWTAIVDIWNER